MDKKGITSVGIAIIVAAVIVLGGVAYYVTRQAPVMETPSEMMMKDDAMMEDEGGMMNDDAMMKDESVMMKDDAMMKDEGMMKGEEVMQQDSMQKDGAMMDGKDKMMASGGTYADYSADKLSLAAEGDVVLFFHADWCPVCRGIESEIKASATALPADLHVLKVDFDSATDLRKKYGVTSQYTFVQVDAQGNALKKWSASSLSAVLASVI